MLDCTVVQGHVLVFVCPNNDVRLRCKYRATFMVMVQGQVTVLVGLCGAITWLRCGARPSHGVSMCCEYRATLWCKAQVWC